jgi:hypothetical protein
MGGTGPTASAQGEPDLILHDAVVLTLDAEDTVASAIAIAGDTIVAVGSDTEILALAGPGTTVVDLDGLAVLPGFIDSHSHWIGDRELYGVSTAEEAIQMALEGGWTSINELFVNQDRLDELMALDAAGDLRLRVNAYLPVNYENQRFGMWFSDLTPGEQVGARLRLAGVKFFIDACGPTTQYLSEPRPNGDRGRFHWGRRELRRMVARVHDAGWQIAAHACGDGAIDEILDALERAFDGGTGKPFRARIEHLITLRDDQITRMRRLHVLPSFQLTFMDSLWAQDYETMFPKDRRELLGRWRDLASDPRLHAIGSTDSPYGEGPDLAPTSAMSALAQGVTRIGEPGDRVPRWMRDQRLTLMQALHLLTTAGAYGVFAEDELGMIAPDMLADIVVLSDDPRAVPPAELGGVDVAMVFVGGVLEVCAAGYEARCPSLPG